MTAPIHLLIRGTPVSFRSKRQVVKDWRNKVAAAAREIVKQPTDSPGLSVSITHFYRTEPRCDADNVSKPICDALTSVVYQDDRQVKEYSCRRIPLGRAFAIWGMPRELAVALSQGDECVFIRITPARADSWWLFRDRAAFCLNAILHRQR